jgi:hypothetical protein
MVLEDGFAWRGRRYTSLSVIAREITGTRWNGWVFFGLKQREENKARSEPPAAKIRRRGLRGRAGAGIGAAGISSSLPALTSVVNTADSREQCDG